MGASGSKAEAPLRTLPGVPFEGKPRLCMAAMKPSHNAGRARRVMNEIEKVSEKYETWHAVFPRTKQSGPFFDFVEALKKELPDAEQQAYASRTGWSSPFVWLEHPDGTRHALGGRDGLCEWAVAEFASHAKLVSIANTPAKGSDAYVSLTRPGTAGTQVRP